MSELEKEREVGEVESDSDVAAATAARKGRVEELSERSATVRQDIDALEAQNVVDRQIIGQLVADGVADREKIANLELALVSARRIGAAMGILMHARKITDLEAFGLLRDASQVTHRKLRDVADQVVLTGALPGGTAN